MSLPSHSLGEDWQTVEDRSRDELWARTQEGQGMEIKLAGFSVQGNRSATVLTETECGRTSSRERLLITLTVC